MTEVLMKHCTSLQLVMRKNNALGRHISYFFKWSATIAYRMNSRMMHLISEYLLHPFTTTNSRHLNWIEYRSKTCLQHIQHKNVARKVIGPIMLGLNCCLPQFGFHRSKKCWIAPQSSFNHCMLIFVDDVLILHNRISVWVAISRRLCDENCDR